MASSSVMCSSSSTTSTVGRSGSVATAHTVRRAAAVRTGTGAFGGNSKERSRAFPGPGRTLSAMSQVAQAHPEPSTAKPLVVGTHRPATVEIVVPVYNEEAELEASVRRLHSFLTERFPLSWLVTIADNASTDGTWGIACRLA